MNSSTYEPMARIHPRFFREGGATAVVTANERRVLSEVWNAPGLTRSALGGRLDLTQQSIHRIVSHLEERGLLLLGDLEPPPFKGQPSPRLLLNPRYACAIGISINTDNAGVALMDFAGHVSTHALSIDRLSMEEALTRIDKEIAALLAKTGFERGDVFGVGFAISGFLVEGTAYNAPEPLSQWSLIQLGPLLAEWFGKPVWTENGANTGALCERMLGVGRTVRDFVYLSFNYGFGGGIVLNGELVRGGFGNAGELSGMFTPEESLHRPRLASLLEMLQANGVPVFTIDDLGKRFDMAWPGVAEWLDRVTQHHNRVVNVLNAVVDPEVVVFGGQIPRPLAEALIARTVVYGSPRHGVYRKFPKLVVSEIGGETAAIGAASLPLKEVFF